jgi:hypothetical protein
MPELGSFLLTLQLEAVAEPGDLDTGEALVDFEQLPVAFLARGALGPELVDGVNLFRSVGSIL